MSPVSSSGGLELSGRPDATGQLDYAEGDKVAQSIRIILDTEPGERIMRPTFGAGCGAISCAQHDRDSRADPPRRENGARRLRAAHHVTEIRVDRANDPALGADPHRLRPSRDNRPGNLVFPFTWSSDVPLPSPILDDRSYQQLRDELVRRIPVYTPEWTDHNASDPGITLIELFAFLGENLLYPLQSDSGGDQARLPQAAADPAAPGRRRRARCSRLNATDQAGASVWCRIGTEAQGGRHPVRDR